MKRQMIVKHVLLVGMFTLPVVSYGAAAYIPHALKQCMSIINEVATSDDYKKSFDELSSVIAENRMLASEGLTRHAVIEALACAKRNRNKFVEDSDYDVVKQYLKKYLSSLDETSILLTVDGDSSFAQAWPTSLVRKSVLNDKNASASFDLMRLSSELVSAGNIALCGDVSDVYLTRHSSLEQSISYLYKSVKSNNSTDPGVYFNPNMITSSTSATPTVIFGTGASSSIINAWAISPSSSMQFPVNMQFAVPGDLKSKKAISLELHFLVRRHSDVSGKIRIRVKAEYMDQKDSFDVLAANPSFTDTTDSHNFKISEPNNFNEVKHIYVTIPLENSSISTHDLALLSLTRIAPTSGAEYAHDIYLAAAVFRYTSKD